MSESKATLVVTATPNPTAMEDVQAYLAGVTPLLMAADGEMVYRGKTEKTIKGDVEFLMLLVMHFNTQNDIETLFSSSEYAALIPMRDRGFKAINITISASL